MSTLSPRIPLILVIYDKNVILLTLIEKGDRTLPFAASGAEYFGRIRQLA
jgi:hypothetical protein